ncbi:NAD(P)-dependent oxidoreductase [Pseudactinotalea suaedae]|uniref:NAD(P)-dependent oxidoreductase n=1 Tax=Pseudactinotalea suaedae TaxID=1524924 RepID=UPI00139182EB|nr:NAD(P)-dependent oxidoreductase [Pseudactinotalea suaedae]
MYRIFVSQPIPEPALEYMREHAEVEVFRWQHREMTVPEVEDAVKRADYLYCMHTIPVTRSVVEANPNLLGYGVAGTRGDIHDLEAVEEAGIPWLVAEHPTPPENPEDWDDNGWGLNPRATADLLVTHVLSAAYRFVESDRYCRERRFFQEMTMDLMGLGCTGKTVALYGFGKVARQAAKRFKALDMRVLYTKRTRLSPEEEVAYGVEWVADPDDLFREADFVCLLTNAEPQNLKMVTARHFSLMKPTAYFFNVARGRLVDQDALIAALQAGTIAGAGLDVFTSEPPKVIEPYVPEEFVSMPNVSLTPHNGGATYRSRGAQCMAIAEAIVSDIKRREAESAQVATA